MRRNPNAQPTLKHLAFFEAVADHPEGSQEANAATAGLLVLRLIDHWTQIGSPMVEPDSLSIRSNRDAIMALPALDPLREVLLGIVNTMQTLREVELSPVLPRLQAYGTLLERRTQYRLALDVYETVLRLSQPGYDLELQYDAWMSAARCHHEMGQPDEAEAGYAQATALAKRMKSAERALRARIASATVPFGRGNFPGAKAIFDEVDDELQRARLSEDARRAIRGTVFHARSSIATRERKLGDALRYAHSALGLLTAPLDRERLLANLATILLTAERFDAARHALMIIDLTTIREDTRTIARANLHSLAARTGDRELFDRMLRELEGRELPAQVQANVLIESARGYRLFGEEARAIALLHEARAFAMERQLNRSVFEVDELLAGREPFPLPETEDQALEPKLRDTVEAELRDELAQLVRA